MITPDDERRIEDMIAAKLDIMSAFRDLPEAARESIANDLGPYLYSRQQSLRKPENFYTPRWTVDMANINEDDAGVEKGHAGPTMPRWVDIIGGTAHLDGDDPQILHFRAGGGGADCMFDYLVSTCWATEVAAGRGTEGQTMTSLTGCTFKVYSTIAGAMAAMAALPATTNSVLFICGGTYAEQVSTGLPSAGSWDIYGAGSGRVNWAATANGQTLLTFATLAAGSRVHIRGIHFNLSTFTGCTGLASANGFGVVTDCHFTTGGDSTSTGIALNGTLFLNCIGLTFGGDGIGYKCSTAQLSTWTGCYFACLRAMDLIGNRIVISNCVFATTGTGDLEFGTSTSEVSVTNCQFGTGVHFGGTIKDNIAFVGNTFRLGSGQIGLNFSDVGTNSDGFTIIGNTFYSTQATAIGIKLDPQMITGVILGNTFNDFTSGNEITGTGGGVTGAHNVSNNGAIADFGSPVGHVGTGTGGAAPNDADYLVGTANATLTNEIVVGTTPGGELGGTWAAPTVDATHSGSAHHDAVTAGSGIGVSGQVVSLGNLTAQYDQAGAFDWVYRGGNLYVANSKSLSLYSDNTAGTPTTRTASIDGTTGHLTVGGATAPPARTSITVADNYTDPAGVVAGLAFTPTIAFGAGNANAVTGLNLALTTGGAFAHTGIIAGIKATYLSSTGALPADLRHFWALCTMSSASSVLTDRYGLYIANATGGGAVTNQYGVYIENMAKGGTINRAIQSLGGLSTHLGALRLGSNTAPTNTTDGDLTATRLIVPDAAILHSAITQLGGPVVIPTQGALRLSDTDNSHYTGLKAHGTTTATVEYTLPPADGTSGFQLTTDGAGVLSWASAGGAGGGHTIRENGTDQTARTGLNFIDTDAGAGLITDDAGGNETEVNLNLYILKSTFNAKGDLIGASADNTPSLITAGSNGTVPMYDSAQTAGIKATNPALIAWAMG